MLSLKYQHDDCPSCRCGVPPEEVQRRRWLNSITEEDTARLRDWGMSDASPSWDPPYSVTHGETRVDACSLRTVEVRDRAGRVLWALGVFVSGETRACGYIGEIPTPIVQTGQVTQIGEALQESRARAAAEIPHVARAQRGELLFASEADAVAAQPPAWALFQAEMVRAFERRQAERTAR